MGYAYISYKKNMVTTELPISGWSQWKWTVTQVNFTYNDMGLNPGITTFGMVSPNHHPILEIMWAIGCRPKKVSSTYLI